MSQRKTLSANSRRRNNRLGQATCHLEPLENRLFFSTYTVTSLADDGSSGTLGWAVNQANNSTDASNTINFSPGLTGTIALQNGELELMSGTDTTIQGPGAGLISVSGNDASTIFRVDFGAQADISGLTLTGGNDGIGGAIDSSGTLSISDCVITDNTVSTGVGGAIFSSGTLSLDDTTLSGNTAGDGAAVYQESGLLDVQGCTFNGNTSSGEGGAIEADFTTANIVNSTFNGNSASTVGGAIYVNDATVTVTNSTIAGNSASDGGGVYTGFSGDVTLYNTIVAGNSTTGTSTTFDISGALDQSLADSQTASSNNLIGTGGAGGLVNGDSGNLVGVTNADLGPLQNNGGPTDTMALLPGSPAIDAGDNALALDVNGNPLTTDQRDTGFPRVNGSAVDIGAFESAPIVQTAALSNLTAPLAISTGTASVTVGGTISAASSYPPAGETVAVTLNGVTVNATIGAQGAFSATFNTAKLPASFTPYVVSYSYAGDANFTSATDDSTTTITVSAPVTPGTKVTPTLTVGSLTLAAGGKAKLTATLLGTGSAPLANRQIVFTLNGIVVGKACTNCKGVATIDLRVDGIAPGTYATALAASFAGDKNDTAVTAAGSLTVTDPPINEKHLHVTACGDNTFAFGTFKQAGDFASASDFTITINWGDGSAVSSATAMAVPFSHNWFVLAGTHNYVEGKTKETYTVTVTITSKSGATATVSDKVCVK